MSNVRTSALSAMVRAAMWLSFLLGAAATLMPMAHGQTTGLPAPLTGDCVTNAAGSVVCTKTNGATFGSPTSFAQGFSASQNHLWLMTEGSGNTLADYFGTANATSNGAFTWTADGGLSFSGGYANRAVATNATTFLTMEVVVVNGMPMGVTYNVPMAYGGATSGATTRSQAALMLSPNWMNGSNAGTSTAASLSTYLGFLYKYNAFAHSAQSSRTSISTGVHLLDYEAGPNQSIQIYVDGETVLNLSNIGGADGNPTLINGGFIEIGGSPLGYDNCPATTCGFTGTIYGAATYAGRLTQAQIRQNWATWQSVLQAKGVNLNQFAYTNSGNGAQGAAGKAVNMVCYGESITWGHGSVTPYCSSAATSINGGNAFGLGYGYDSRTEFTMHTNLGAVQAMYSPSATNVAVLFTNANDCRVNGTLTGAETYTSNVAQQAAHDLVTDARTLQAQGWVVLLGTGLSGTPTAGSGDVGKGACNSVLRQQALAAGIPLWDSANDPRFGADGAYANPNPTACGGSGCYGADQLHPSQGGQIVLGVELSSRVNALLYSAPATTTASTYAMTGTEQPLMANPATNSQTVTLPDCIGFTATTFSVTNLQTSGANTVTIVPASSGETMNGLTTYTLPNASTATFKAIHGTDAVAGCTWQMR